MFLRPRFVEKFFESTIANCGLLEWATHRPQAVRKEASKSIARPQVQVDSGADCIDLSFIKIPEILCCIENVPRGFNSRTVTFWCGCTHARSMLLN